MASPRVDPAVASSLEPTVLRALGRYRLLAAGIVLAAVLVAAALSFQLSGGYSATMDVIVRDPRTTQVFESDASGFPERYVADQAAVFGSTNVAARVMQLAAAQDPPIELTLDQVESESRVETDPDNSQIGVTFQSETAEDAVTVANLFLQAYEEVRSESATAATRAALDQLDATIASIDSQLSELNAEITSLIQDTAGADVAATTRAALDAVARAAESGDSSVLATAVARLDTLVALDAALRATPEIAPLIAEQTQLATRRAELVSRRDQIAVDAQLATSGIVLASPALQAQPVPGDGLRLMLAGLIVGGLIAALICYVLALRRYEFTDRRQPETVLRVPLLASVPEFAEADQPLPIVVAPTSVEAESYRFAAASLRVLAREKSSSVVGIVSSTLGDGKTSLAANIAIALAEDGVRVVVVDGDLARQGLTSLLLEPGSRPRGLREALDGEPAQQFVRSIQPWPMAPTFDLLPAGDSQLVERAILPEPMAAVLASLRSLYDLVLVDTPPLLQVASASTIVSLIDGVVAVVPHGSSVSRCTDLAERVARADASLLGYVYNRDRSRSSMQPYAVEPDGEPSKRQAWSRR